MLKNFNKEYFMSNRACYSKEKMQNLVDNNPHSTIEDFLSWDISNKDKLYFIIHCTYITYLQFKKLVLMCAKTVLPIYEEKYPDSKKVSEFISETEKYIKGNSSKKLLIVKRQADAIDAIHNTAYYAVKAAFYADYAIYYDATNAADDKQNYNQILLDNIKQWCSKQKETKKLIERNYSKI